MKATWTADGLRQFGQAVQRLMNQENLAYAECYDLFCQVLRNEQPDLQQGAFLAALAGKGETADEVAAAWQAIDEIDTIHTQTLTGERLLENSGTGMDALKTFNVSSAAAIVAAACGVRIARHGARALTSTCGTVDILEAVGVDMECELGVVEASIREVGIGVFNGMSAWVHPGALGRILSQIRFGSTLNLAASLANPARPTLGVRGVYDPALIPVAHRVMLRAGYEAGLVVHGYNATRDKGMDEVSVCGATQVFEFQANGASTEYWIEPEAVGVKRWPYEPLRPCSTLAGEAVRFVQVLAGEGHEACVDFMCVNAAAILKVWGVTTSWQEGVALSRDAIRSGAARRRLQDWVTAQQAPDGDGGERYAAVSNRAGLERGWEADGGSGARQQVEEK